MPIKIICSAFRSQYTSSMNALATGDLIRHFARTHEVELVTGSYVGQKEIALEVKGFLDMEEALAAAKTVIVRFGQEAVLVMDENHDGILVHAKSTTRLGLMCLTDELPQNLRSASYTAYANGDYLYAAQDAATGLKLAA